MKFIYPDKEYREGMLTKQETIKIKRKKREDIANS